MQRLGKIKWSQSRDSFSIEVNPPQSELESICYSMNVAIKRIQTVLKGKQYETNLRDQISHTHLGNIMYQADGQEMSYQGSMNEAYLSVLLAGGKDKREATLNFWLTEGEELNLDSYKGALGFDIPVSRAQVSYDPHWEVQDKACARILILDNLFIATRPKSGISIYVPISNSDR